MIVHVFITLCTLFIALLSRSLYLIFYKNGFIPKSNSRHHPARTMIILGSGGHTTEILRIVSNMKSKRYSPRIYVRASTDTISEDKVKSLEGDACDYEILVIRRSREVHQSYFTSIWTTIIATLDSIPIVWTARPDLILCNGFIAMDISSLAREILSSKSLLNDIETNSPYEIKIHLISIFNKLWNSVYTEKNTLPEKWITDTSVTLDACLDRTWESLNSGCWKDVSINYRYCYSFCTILKTALMLIRFENEETTQNTENMVRLNSLLKEIILQIDKGILLGAPPLSMPSLLPTIARKLNSIIVEMNRNKSSNVPDPVQLGKTVSKELLAGFTPMARCYRPSMEAFHRDIFHPKIPSVLEGCIDHWKALDLWRDPEYLLRTAGVRTVPIEIGSRYTEEDWTQRLVTFSEFLESYVTSDPGSSKPGYLAQHELFEQIPELMDDISVPDYCSFSDTEDEATAPDINAWLGPAGTISPLHFDPKNNLLCQVFGAKQVVLFHPDETPNLYPYETRLLSNTARVDPVNPDLEICPKFKKSSGVTCTLGPGEMLFIPPGWWHHVISLSPSFSVSFWWN